MGFVYLRLYDTGLGPGCRTNMSPSPPQPVPLGAARELGRKPHFENGPIGVLCGRVEGRSTSGRKSGFASHLGVVNSVPRGREPSGASARMAPSPSPRPATGWACCQMATTPRVSVPHGQRGWPLLPRLPGASHRDRQGDNVSVT